jgi:hypothetical protein
MRNPYQTMMAIALPLMLVAQVETAGAHSGATGAADRMCQQTRPMQCGQFFRSTGQYFYT